MRVQEFWLFVLQAYCIQQTASQNSSSILFSTLSMNSVTTLSATNSPLSSIQALAVKRTVSTRNQTTKFLIPTTVRRESKSTSSHLIIQPSSVAATPSMSPYNFSSTPSISPKPRSPRRGPPELSDFGIVMISFAGFLIVGLVVALIWMRRNRESGYDGPRTDVKMKPWGKGGHGPKPPEASTSDLDQSEVSEQPTRITPDHPLSRSNPNLSNGSFDREGSGNNNAIRAPEGTWRESKMI